jgi:hypothetical protein
MKQVTREVFFREAAKKMVITAQKMEQVALAAGLIEADDDEISRSEDPIHQYLGRVRALAHAANNAADLEGLNPEPLA